MKLMKQARLHFSRSDASMVLKFKGIHAEWGPGALRYAAESFAKDWHMKSEQRSPRYTTHWGELPRVRA